MSSTSQADFWHYLNILVARHKIVIDRPLGSSHPRYSDVIYPVDYGYLEGTTSIDQDGIDVWLGKGSNKGVFQAAPRVISALILTIDLVKNDAEIKIAVNCSEEEIQTILSFHKSNKMGATVFRKPMEDKESL